jgi:hypothetical protein
LASDCSGPALKPFYAPNLSGNYREKPNWQLLGSVNLIFESPPAFGFFLPSAI